MKVILLERVPNLGIMGEVKTVKDGYARNYLLPQKKALRASKGNLESFEAQRHQLEAANITRREEAQAVASRMQDVFVSVIRSASEAGHLYGSVRSGDIAEALKETGYSVGKSQIVLSTPIKTLGQHRAKVVLHPEVSIDISVIVARSAEEAAVKIEAFKGPTSEEAPSEEPKEATPKASRRGASRKSGNETTIAQAIEAELNGLTSE
jgi:large subunit ribosomal protein L9